ncbi:hypothetical protein MNBD_ALPHA11-2135, partial [hydrothermal vent metagenome]
ERFQASALISFVDFDQTFAHRTILSRALQADFEFDP